jgi:hypothetical protein
MILGNRPVSFFGPDCCDPENWKDARSRIVASQLEWDSKFLSLPWYKQIWSRLQGEETEPVNTSEGMPIDTLVNECLTYKMEKKLNTSQHVMTAEEELRDEIRDDFEKWYATQKRDQIATWHPEEARYTKLSAKQQAWEVWLTSFKRYH